MNGASAICVELDLETFGSLGFEIVSDREIKGKGAVVDGAATSESCVSKVCRVDASTSDSPVEGGAGCNVGCVDGGVDGLPLVVGGAVGCDGIGGGWCGDCCYRWCCSCCLGQVVDGNCEIQLVASQRFSR